MAKSREVLEITEKYGARNYLPLPVVLSRGEGVWVEDPEGNRYMDMLSAYSAMNFGHVNTRIVKALKDQADKITLTSRAFHNDQLGPFCAKLAGATGKEMVLPMNTGAEAVETAVKAVRRWAYRVKNIPADQAEIIVCKGNFHGRTLTIISFSSDESYKADFGPFTPGFRIVDYGSIEALKEAINKNTCAFLFEPIQAEGGIIIPPDGYLKEAFALCRKNNVMIMADEIQTAFGRTGKMFACEWEDEVPDVYILGKSLGGGVIPISAVAADEEFLGVFEPGSHGSTFGGNPLACAVAITVLDILTEGDLIDRVVEKGTYLVEQLRKLKHPAIREIRGRGLLIGIELKEKARPYCEELMKKGILAKETHENVIRLAPPLIISEKELDWAMEVIRKVFS
ncbi:MAG TPA: ornithine--oxo-acid transaminase [Firmicutes bacterium]|nr:ornithine--oxo-acid transaminase [Bacillota bacterium]